MSTLDLHPERLLPADPATRRVAADLYDEVRELPIVSFHGHIEARVLAENRPFRDPASLLVTCDHYVTRVLHARGVPLEALGRHRRGDLSQEPPDPEAVWRLFCQHWPALYGTASHLWLAQTLVELFGVDEEPGEANADDLFWHIDRLLGRPEMAPRALLRRFGVEVLATTDSPLASLAWHRALAEDPGFEVAVIPTLRPDALFDPARPGWLEDLEALSERASSDTTTFEGFLEALRVRRSQFAALGAVATDHAVRSTWCGRPLLLSDADLAGLYGDLRRGDLADAEVFTGVLLEQMAAMSCDDGLVMQLHLGMVRDHDAVMAARFGPDIGADFPEAVRLTESLRPLLEFGHHDTFRLVVYTADEAAYGRELAPLASYYPSLYLGAPWWFLDAPDAMGRCLRSATESAGFSKFAGFVDDARSLPSIPARHDTARRVLCGELATLVAEHRLSLEAARRLALDFCGAAPRRVFRWEDR